MTKTRRGQLAGRNKATVEERRLSRRKKVARYSRRRRHGGIALQDWIARWRD